MNRTVLVTGGSGYIAGFLIRDLIEHGWRVRTTVRSLTREATLREQLGVDNSRLTVCEAELLSDQGWAHALHGCEHVAHLASPVPSRSPRDEDEVIRPAREGALRVLRLAAAAGVRRFVMTSSVAAICYGHPPRKTAFTESDWTNVESLDAYAYVKSKTLAERAARDWVGRNAGGMEFCTINPSLVLGPVMSRDFSASLLVLKKLLEGTIPGLPDIGFGIVDVRDVADLHLRALTEPRMAGERFICSGDFLMLADIARVLRERLGPRARKVPAWRLPDWVVHVVSLIDPSVRQVRGELGKVRRTDASHARERLGWVARPNDEVIVDAARSLIELGAVRA